MSTIKKLFRGVIKPVKTLEQTLIVMHVYMGGTRFGSSEISWREVKENRKIKKLKVTLIDEEFDFNPDDNYLSEGGINNKDFVSILNSLGWTSSNGKPDELLFEVIYDAKMKLMHYRYICKIDSSVQYALDFKHIGGWKEVIVE